MRRPVVLVIRDGWGENTNKELEPYNAVVQAKTPVCDDLKKHYPRSLLKACGRDVGLPDGVMGNSEVGHQNIGAGRIVDQEIVRIDKAFASDGMLDNAVLSELIANAKSDPECAFHLMGLCSDAGVHAHIRHLEALLRLCKEAGLKRVFIHVLSDGRDSGPQDGIAFIERIERFCAELGVGKIASVCGRYWAMDRDERWDRVKKAYHCLTGQLCDRLARSAKEALQSYYDKPKDPNLKGDEFVLPTWIAEYNGSPLGPIMDGDSVLFFNFRGDRPRELVRAFVENDFEAFERGHRRDLCFATLTDYQEGLCERVVFPRLPKMEGILGELVSQSGLKQFRCAETEKYPHVTFFFNDYREEPFEGEERVLVPSPRDVATYDQKPQMSANAVCKATQEAILSKQYALIVVNFANPDMVGHTGSLEAAVEAAETVDACVGQIMDAVDSVGGCAIVTADHGNADQMYRPDTKIAHTQHTLNPVELLLCGKGCEDVKLRKDGRLGDIAPTIVDLLGLVQPKAMTGDSLLRA